MLALERMEKIARWEACSENSAEFRAVAAHIDAELHTETRHGLVAETDLDEGHMTGNLACDTIAINASETGSIVSCNASQVSDTDTYESSFIDDEDMSTQAGSDSSVEISSTNSSTSSDTSVTYTSDVANVVEEVHAEPFQSFTIATCTACTDSNDSLRVRNGDETMSMLRELPGAELTRINPEDLDFSSPLSAWPGNFPFNGDVSVSYSHDEVNDINNINATNYTFQ